MRRIVLAAFTLTVLAACQPPITELTEEQKASITDTIYRMMDEALAAMSALDVDRANAPYARDLVYVSGGIIQSDWATIEPQVRAHYGSLLSGSGSWGEKHVRVLGPDAAVATMGFDLSFTDTTGVQTDMEGAATYVFALLDDGWKIVSAHASYLPPETQ